MYEFEKYMDKNGKWRWRLRSINRNIVATCGGQGYENERDMDNVIKNIQSMIALAHVKTVAK